MTKAERQPLPEWAKRERASDLKCIKENLHVFWPAAQRSYAEQGRGAIVVETSLRPTGAGNPFLYLDEKGIREMDDADALRMVLAYDPSWEIVAMLLKGKRRVSTYRIGIPQARARNATRGGEGESQH